MSQNLPSHLQKIKEEADEFQLKYAREDNFPPRLRPDDGPIIARMIGPSISYYFTTKVFIKRQPHPVELGLDLYGNQKINPYIADRLRNEAAVLHFVAAHTTVPVPKFLDLWEENGLLYLKTAIVDTGVELQHLHTSLLPSAIAAVTSELESTIFPQLRRQRRNFLGSPDPNLPVVPPRRLWDWKDTRVWPSMRRQLDDYVLCHTDLDLQNILVDPNTFKIVSILDWETAGFFPSNWELRFWEAGGQAEKHKMSMKSRDRELLLFNSLGSGGGNASSYVALEQPHDSSHCDSSH